MINKRLSALSCNKDEFHKAKLLQKKSLRESGYKASMSYAPTEVKTNKNRSWNIIWFNPPFSQNIKTNIGKIFLKLIRKHFPNHRCLYKIFNLSTIKSCYRCRITCFKSYKSWVISFIKQHNRNISSSSPNSEEHSCNCRNKDNCPLAGSCLKTCIVYTADVIKQNKTPVYYGASDGEFKYQYNNHTNSFQNEDYENKTVLSKHIWQLNIMVLSSI